MYEAHHLVSTPENVDLHFELAGLGNRVLACLIDTFITYLVVGLIWMIDILFYFPLKPVLKYIPLTESNSLILINAIAILISFIVIFGYFIFFEGIWNGQTPGKKFARIRVIKDNGEPISWFAALLRNILRTFDEVVFVIGILFIVVEKSEKRLGDLAASTIVIRERASFKKILETNKVIETATKDPTIRELDESDYNLVTDFLWRRKYMVKPYRTELATKIASYISQKLGTNLPTNAEGYLEQLSL